MKKIKSILILLFVSASLRLIAADPNAELKSSFLSFVQNVESNRSLTLAAYPTYAPQIVVNGKKDTFGVGIAGLAPASLVPALADNSVAQHAFAGIRFDYLAHQAFASTVALGLRGDFQIYGHNFTLFAHSGVNIPFEGFGQKNGELGAMAGGGIYTSLLTFANGNGSLGLQVSGEKWTQFQGYVLHGGPVLNWKF